MQIGDIILVHNKICPMSWFIRYKLKSNYSHVAFVFHPFYLIEIGATGVRIRPSNYYQKKIYNSTCIRYKKINANMRLYFTKHVLNITTERYAYLSFIKILFELARRKEDVSRFTCSGFVASIFDNIGIKINEDISNPKLITPKDFENNNLFC